MMLHGSAGTGKSRTVRSFVAALRRKVRADADGAIQRARAAGRDVSDHVARRDERLQNVALLAAPTGCASFQLKFGASTLHRIFGVPVGFCGPWRNRDDDRFKKFQKRMTQSRLFVMDEMSMIGRQMLGKIGFRAEQLLGQVCDAEGRERYLGGKDCVLAGDPKQCQPVGDDALYTEGAYSGKGKNMPKGASSRPAGAWSPQKFHHHSHEIMRTFQDVSVLRQVHRYEDENADIPEEKKAAYRKDAKRFLEVTRGMADCTWEERDHAWLSARNRSVLQQTEEGRRELEKFKDAPLLMDGRKDSAVTAARGAIAVNLRKLQELAVRTGKPIAGLCAFHDKPEDFENPDKVSSDEFRGMEAEFLVCEGAGV